MELFGSFDDLEMPFTEFRRLSNDQKDAAAEYDQHRADLEFLKCSRKEYMKYDAVYRKSKVEFARKAKAMHDGNN